MKDRGILVHVQWYGQAHGLELSAVRRIAFAYGLGASSLCTSLDVFRQMAKDLKLKGVEDAIKRWTTKGRNEGSLAVCRKSEVVITPTDIFSRSVYSTWRRRLGKDRVTTVKNSLTASTPDKRLKLATLSGEAGISKGGEEDRESASDRASTSHGCTSLASPSVPHSTRKTSRGKKTTSTIPGTHVLTDGKNIVVEIPHDEKPVYSHSLGKARLQLGTRDEIARS